MPHAIADVESVHLQPEPNQKLKVKVVNRASRHVLEALDDYRARYEQCQLSKTIHRQLQTSVKKPASRITRVLSLGLGSLHVVKGQSRRLKQLTTLLAIWDSLKRISGESIKMFAQDPAFTRADEAFLTSLNISLLRTSSGSELGEAASFLDSSTLIYSPFLTLEAYEQVFTNATSQVHLVVGDDFNALLTKWPKRSAERAQVEGLMRLGLSKYRRRAIQGEGFWSEGDDTFPMAIYDKVDGHWRREKAI